MTVSLLVYKILLEHKNKDIQGMLRGNERQGEPSLQCNRGYQTKN